MASPVTYRGERSSGEVATSTAASVVLGDGAPVVGDDGEDDQATAMKLQRGLVASEERGDVGDELHELRELRVRAELRRGVGEGSPVVFGGGLGVQWMRWSKGVPMVVRVGLGVVGVERGEANGVAAASDSGERFRRVERVGRGEIGRNRVRGSRLL